MNKHVGNFYGTALTLLLDSTVEHVGWGRHGAFVGPLGAQRAGESPDAGTLDQRQGILGTAQFPFKHVTRHVRVFQVCDKVNGGTYLKNNNLSYYLTLRFIFTVDYKKGYTVLSISR